jgi:succinate-acetate transporter protein
MGDEQKPSFANQAPLGLIAFGLTTVILSLINAGLLPKGASR